MACSVESEGFNVINGFWKFGNFRRFRSGSAMRLLLVLLLAACGLGSLERRARDRIAVLKERLAEEQGRRPPLIVPIFGPGACRPRSRY